MNSIGFPGFVVACSLLWLAPLLSDAATPPSQDFSEWHKGLEGTRPGTILTVDLRDGGRLVGALAEFDEEGFGLWVDPSEPAQVGVRYLKVKRRVRYGDVQSILGLGPRRNAATFREDLKSQPYVFGGGGSFRSGGSAFEIGGGLDWLVKGGLGLGGSVSVLAGGGSGIGVASFDVSYHFIRDSSRLVPFVFAGVAGGSAPEFGTDGYTFLNLGGGVNLWEGGTAFRFEARARIDPSKHGDHHFGLRLGVTF